MYTKHLRINGINFIQQMDLDTDTAIYKDPDGKVLMTVDSSGNCFDAEGKPFGKFGMNHGSDNSWFYENEGGTMVIQTLQTMLFDKAEPIVIAALFAKELA